MATMVRTSADLVPQPAAAAVSPAATRRAAAMLRMQRGAGNQALQRFFRARTDAERARDATGGELMPDAERGAVIGADGAPEAPTGALSGAGRLDAPAPDAVRADRQPPRGPGAPEVDPARAARTSGLDADPTLAMVGAPRVAEPLSDVGPPARAPVQPALRATNDPGVLQAQTARAIGQIPRPSLGDFTPAQAAIRARGFHSAATYAAARSAASSGPSRERAAAALVSDPIKPSEPDPSPKTTKEIRKKSGRPLDKVEAPDITTPPSPQVHVPDLARVSQEGYKPISSQDFHALMAISASDRVIASLTDEERALLKTDLDRLQKLREELLAPPQPEPAPKPKTKEEKKKEERQRIVEDLGAPPPFAVGEEDKGKLTAVFARLLAEADVTAEAIMHKIRQNVPEIGFALDQKFPDLGNKEHKAEIRGEVEKRIEQLRDAAGITKEELDKKIAERRAELERLRAQAAAGTQAATAGSLQQVGAEGDKTDAATAGARKGADKKAEKVKKAAEKAKLPMDVGSRRTRLLADTTRVITEQATAYKQRLELHQRRIDGLTRRMNLAYRYAAQQDELQIATRAGKNAATAAVADETKKTRDWLAEREKAATAFADERKKGAEAQSKTYQDELHAAGDARREALRAWADTKLKTNRSTQDKDRQRADDAAEQLKAEASAWEKVQNQRAVEGMLGEHGDFALVQKMAADVKGRQDRDAYIEKEHLAGDQVAVLDAYLGVLDPQDVSAIVMKGEDKETNGVTAGMLIRLGQTLGEKIVPKMEDYLLAEHAAEWRPLNELGSLQHTGRSEPFEAAKIGNRVRDAVDRIGTKEEWIFTALDKLSRIQIQAVRSYYLEKFETTIDADLEDDMSGRELERAKALLEGQSYKADAIGLRQAMKGNWEGALGGIGSISGAGTDEAAMHEIMRNRSPQERAAVIRAYNEMFDPELKALIEKVKTQEERDKIYAAYAKDHPSKLLADAASEMEDERDGERFEAEAAGNDDLADAIELRDVLPTPDIVNRPDAPPIQADHEKVSAIYDRIRREVTEQGSKGNWTQAQIEGEIARRANAVESYFNAKYAKDYDAGPKGALRTAFDVGFKLSPERANLAYALADNDVARADAAKVRIEHEGLWASDDVLNDILAKQYERALEANRRDEMPLRGLLMARQLTDLERKDIEAGKGPWTGAKLWEERERLQRKMDRTFEQGAREQAKGNMLALRVAYWRDYHADLDEDIEADTSGYSGRKAKTLLEQDGYLTPAQTVFYAIRGTGTDEAALRRALEGRTAEELDEIRKEFRKLAIADNSTALGVFNSMFDSPFEDRTNMDAQIAADLSGREGFDIGQLLKGAPETIEQKRQRLMEAIEYERDVGPMGDALAGDAVTSLDKDIAYLDETIKKLNDPTLTPTQREMYLGFYEQNIQTVDAGIQEHRRQLDTWVDRITTAIGVVIAAITVAIISFVTLGAGGVVLVALLGSILATAATMATKQLILGQQYGWEDIGTDLAIGVADALFAVATAGMGSKLIGAAQASRAAATEATKQGTKRILFQGLRMKAADFFTKGAGRFLNPSEGLLTRLIPKSTALEQLAKRGPVSKLVATIISEGGENLVAGSGSALVGTALNEQTWEHGNPLANLAVGTLQQSAMSAAMGLGFAGVAHVGGKAFQSAGKYFNTLRDPATIEHLEWREFSRQYPDVPKSEWVQARVAAKLEAEVRARGEQLPPIEAGRAEGVPGTAAAHSTERVDGAPSRVPEEARVTTEGVEPPPPKPLTEGDIREHLPADIREQVPVKVDNTLTGRTVKVEFTKKWGGITDVRIVAGPGARPIDIMLHAPTVQAARRYTGLSGRAIALLERVRWFFVKNGVPPVGTRAFEAYHELNKLPLVIEERMRRLSSGSLDPDARLEILADIEQLSRQLDDHAATLDRLDMAPGQGYIAALDQRVPEPVDFTGRPDRGDLELPRYQVEDSPLGPEKVFQVGSPWIEDGRIYRLIERLDDQGRRVEVREEIAMQTNGVENGFWHQRGSDIVGIGKAAELASSRQSFLETLAERQGKALDVPLSPELTKRPGDTGFDQVIIRFDENGQATIVLVEVKDYKRYVGKKEFTAINDNLIDNLHHLYSLLSHPDAPTTLGLSETQIREARLAIGELRLEVEIRITERTKLGTKDTGTVVEDLEAEIREKIEAEISVKLGQDTQISVVRRGETEGVDPALLERAKLDVVAGENIGQTPRFVELAQTKGAQLTEAGVKQAQAAMKVESLGDVVDKPLRRGDAPDTFVDAQNNRIVVVEPAKGTKAAPLAEELIDRLRQTEIKPPDAGPRDTRVLLDVTEMNPQQRTALRRQLAERAKKDPSLEPLLDRLQLVDVRKGTIASLVDGA